MITLFAESALLPNGWAHDERVAVAGGRRVAVTGDTGIGLTLMPVLYQQGGCDERALTAGQLRFGNDMDRSAALWQGGSGPCDERG
jgi:formimidoylglutamate deiminase